MMSKASTGAETVSSWLNKALLLSSDVREQKGTYYLPDSLLVSSPPTNGMSGLFYLRKGNWIERDSLVTVDKLGTTGIWLGQDCLLRSIKDADHMLLTIYPSSDKVWLKVSPEFGAVHDVRIFDGNIYVVSTGTNEIAVLDWSGNIQNKWTFPGGADAWHINCLDDWNGRIVVSAFGKFNEPAGWRNTSPNKQGIVFDLLTQDVLWSGLSRPHTPRIDERGRKFICDSATGKLLVDHGKNNIQDITFDGAFPRGMAFGEKHIYLGLSSLRHISPSESKSQTAKVAILNRETLETIDYIQMPCIEIYDIAVVNND